MAFITPRNHELLQLTFHLISHVIARELQVSTKPASREELPESIAIEDDVRLQGCGVSGQKSKTPKVSSSERMWHAHAHLGGRREKAKSPKGKNLESCDWHAINQRY